MHTPFIFNYWSSHRYNKEGLIVESWNLLDNATLMQQLGVLPTKE